jgi:hypothetical protein
MGRSTTAADETPPSDDAPLSASALRELVSVDDMRPEDSESTCLRPLGLCELGGCCDSCWYSPDHPRFQK